jgi:short-subunit dehydrogenase
MAGPGLAVYKVTKHAVLSLSETLYHDLAGAKANVGVSVFCPDVVKTGLRDSGRNRPAALQDEQPRTPEETAAEEALRAATGLSASEAARIAFEGIEAGRLYLFTDSGALEFARSRVTDLEAGIPEPNTTLRADIIPAR